MKDDPANPQEHNPYNEAMRPATGNSYCYKQIPSRIVPDNIDWYMEPMTFETQHEAFEWISSGPYNEIGYLYTGYQTTDEKLANILLFELVRSNTLHGPRFRVQADYEFLSTGLLYKIWVTPLAEPDAEDKA
ncbi:hypothetical protein PAECIP111892_00969 [Paenibacillus auburnensis]|uniref:Uncharacterized protein n=1 Tax=Paenibacillus auburnensis TaxID=2905649 RepID=A0ABM9BQG9_9BACL|nr:hypothetical protein [Paenibacillus auburnensis]CAH1192466.1 hypothetical protein PAECIP111892_00969 [Paenibacillus auburnensis]